MLGERLLDAARPAAVHCDFVRWLSFTFRSLLLAVGAGACGLVAGLGDYADGLAEGGPGVKVIVHPEETGTPDDATAIGPGGDEPSVGPAGDDAIDSSAGEPDTAVDSGSATAVADASDDAQDAAAVCRTQCSGCCDPANVCHGGLSVSTCGSSGEACVDCSASGKVCSSTGTCIMSSVMEAGPPPMCKVGNCKNSCPLLEAPCCKGDQTCGCAVLGLLLCN
jgi:hypothetical protein